MSIIESLKWRSAIKRFDTSKDVSKEDLAQLLEAANLTATSGGLQPFKMVVVGRGELKKKLAPHSYGQPQVGEASHVLIFAVETDIDGTIVDNYTERAAEVRGLGKEAFIGYSDSMKMYITSMDETSRFAWASRQAFIALGTVMTAAADMKIDTCPMEGFLAPQYDEILGLKSKNLSAVVILPIGYRSTEDVHSTEAKVRKARENFTVELN